MSDTMYVGTKLVELCRQGKAAEAIDTLYSPTIVSVEASAPPGMPAKTEGIEAVKGKSTWWEANHQINKAVVDGPFPHGDRFIVRFSYNVTAKGGPMVGQTFDMDEAALYTVADGKITQEEFFYKTSV